MATTPLREQVYSPFEIASKWVDGGFDVDKPWHGVGAQRLGVGWSMAGLRDPLMNMLNLFPAYLDLGRG